MINYLYLCYRGPIGPNCVEDRALLSECFVLGRVTKMNVFSVSATFFTRDALDWIPSEINQNNNELVQNRAVKFYLCYFGPIG